MYVGLRYAVVYITPWVIHVCRWARPGASRMVYAPAAATSRGGLARFIYIYIYIYMYIYLFSYLVSKLVSYISLFGSPCVQVGDTGSSG